MEKGLVWNMLHQIAIRRALEGAQLMEEDSIEEIIHRTI